MYLNFFKPDREHTLSLDYNRDQTCRHSVKPNWKDNKQASETNCLFRGPVVKVYFMNIELGGENTNLHFRLDKTTIYT